LTTACGPAPDASPEALAGAARKREPQRVLVQNAERREMMRVLEATTRVESEHQVEIFARVSGVMTELLVEEGQAVRAGQVLARLDDRDARIAVSEAKVALDEMIANRPKLKLAVEEAQSRLEGLRLSAEQGERDYERHFAIFERGPGQTGLISQTELEAKRLARDTARSQFETQKLTLKLAQADELAGATAVDRAKLNLESAQLTLSFTEVTAPFDGVLAERMCKVGDTCGAAAAVFVITDLSNLRAVFYRPQRELTQFTGAADNRPGNGHDSGEFELLEASAELEISITAEALPGRRFRGVIERTSPTIDPRSGNFRVTARLEARPESGASGRLLPGMLVRLEIVTERRPDALVVHKRAIQREGDVSLIFVVREGLAYRIPVEEALTDDEFVEVRPVGRHELRAGDAVVVVGHGDLEDAVEVDVTRLEGESEAPSSGAEQ
jgi:membrane fusion protein (multidrug efflux system)